MRITPSIYASVSTGEVGVGVIFMLSCLPKGHERQLQIMKINGGS